MGVVLVVSGGKFICLLFNLCTFFNFLFIPLKICSHYGQPVDPENRDENIENKDISDLSRFVTNCFPGLENKPSLVETCIITVQIIISAVITQIVNMAWSVKSITLTTFVVN